MLPCPVMPKRQWPAQYMGADQVPALCNVLLNSVVVSLPGKHHCGQTGSMILLTRPFSPTHSGSRVITSLGVASVTAGERCTAPPPTFSGQASPFNSTMSPG
jgi:hypothetical protein